MKNIISTVILTSVFAVGAHAAPTDVQLADGYNAVGDVGTDINLARQYNILAIDARDGFIKNDFQGTLSANVIAAVVDDAAANRMGVVAASNKGYTVFTGSSVGGSVSQCGDIERDDVDKAASLVVEATIDLDEPNGCGRD